jgi:hypothetical protein
MQNPFNNPAFSMAALTAAINILPNRYGRLEDLNLMPAKPVRQRQIIVEEMNGVLNLLPTLPPGSPALPREQGGRAPSAPPQTPPPSAPPTADRGDGGREADAP